MKQRESNFTWSVPADVAQVTIIFDGKPCEVPAGVTVAAALLGHDDDHFCHSAAFGEKRAPYCLMGVCFECLVEIDGMKNRQACLEPVYDGMRVKRQHGVMQENDEKTI